ncbi:hypothetical protein GIB67_010451, partial [Kingdonia uniflora]
MIHLIPHLNHDFAKRRCVTGYSAIKSDQLFIAIPHLMHVVSPNSHPLRKTNSL